MAERNVTVQASLCYSLRKLAVSIQTIKLSISVGPKMIVNTRLNNEAQVTHMLACAIAYAPPTSHAGWPGVGLEPDGWVSHRFQARYRCLLGPYTPICSSAIEMRWMPLCLQPRNGPAPDRGQVVDLWGGGQIPHCPVSGQTQRFLF